MKIKNWMKSCRKGRDLCYLLIESWKNLPQVFFAILLYNSFCQFILQQYSMGTFVTKNKILCHRLQKILRISVKDRLV